MPFIREQKVREKQHLLHLIARRPDLIPRHMRPFEMLEHVTGIRTIFLCRFLQKM
nr:hypothetical protein [Escherichia coli O25b:H4-ST131]